MRGETGARDLSANVGRHLTAGRSSGGDISADREDSPLQSKRSSMCTILYFMPNSEVYRFKGV